MGAFYSFVEGTYIFWRFKIFFESIFFHSFTGENSDPVLIKDLILPLTAGMLI